MTDTIRLQNQWPGVRMLPLLPILGINKPTETSWWAYYFEIWSRSGHDNMLDPLNNPCSNLIAASLWV